MGDEHRSTEPLTPDQLEAVVEAASCLSYRHRLLSHIIPYSGLTLSEFTHLRRNWIVYSDRDDPDSITIHVPEQSPCAGTTRFEPYSGKRIETRCKSCYQCQPNGVWTPEAPSRVRSIPVHEEIAVEAMSLWFDRYDSIPFTGTGTPYKLMDDIKEEAGLSRDFGFTALRKTFAVLLISKGFESDTVAELMGMPERNRSMLRPLYEIADQPVDWEENPSFVSDSDLLDELRRLTDKFGYPPRREQISKRGKYAYETYYHRFGGLEEAFRAAGIEPPEGRIRREELTKELQRLTDELGHPPTKAELVEQGEYSYDPYRERFGSLDEALEAAGIEIQNGRIPREELLEELRRLSDNLGHPPTVTEIEDRGEYTYSTYLDRFGGVDEAREAAGLLDENS